MANPNVSQSGAAVKAALGLTPASRSAGTVQGSGIDRLGYSSLALMAQAGAVTSTGTATISLEHSDSSGSGYAAFGSQSVTLDTTDTIKKLSIDLAGAKRYVRVKCVTANAAVISAVAAVLGGAVDKPIGDDA